MILGFLRLVLLAGLGLFCGCNFVILREFLHGSLICKFARKFANFLIFALMLMLILVGLLVTLAAVFRIANQEKINVKKFMGFSFLQMYGRPMLLLSALTVLEIATMLLLGSKFGLLLVVIVSLVQIIIFVKYMAHNELKNVLAAFKGE